jgi:hypothetical protein
MKVVLVGQSHGRWKIMWGVAFVFSSTLGAFGAVISAAIYFALSGTFFPIAIIIGFGGPFITVCSGIQRGLKSPLEQLTSLNGSAE